MWRRAIVTVEKNPRRLCRASCSIRCCEMRRVLGQGIRIRLLIFLVVMLSTFMMAYEGDFLWFSNSGSRYSSNTPSAINRDSSDFNLRITKEKSKMGRKLRSLGRDKESPKFQKQKALLCGTDWQEEYVKLHDDILNKRKPPKYLVYFCGGTKYGCGGYGNRLGAISSLFFLAVITERAFLIDWNTSSPIAEYIRPKSIRWNFPASNLHDLKKTYHYWGKGEHEQVNSESQRSSDRFSEFREWLEETKLDKFLNSPVEVITSLWYFAPSLRQHKFAGRFADKLGVKTRGHRYSMVGCAFDFLFDWTPEFDRLLANTRNSLQSKPDVPRLGIHIRMGDTSFSEKSLDQRTVNFKSYFTCAMKLERSIVRTNQNVSLKDVKWFLATDNLDVKEFALRTYPDKVISLAVKVEHINFRDPSSEGMTGMLLDHNMLSESDFLVLSDSSFSKTALGMNFHSLEHSTFGNKCSRFAARITCHVGAEVWHAVHDFRGPDQDTPEH